MRAVLLLALAAAVPAALAAADDVFTIDHAASTGRVYHLRCAVGPLAECADPTMWVDTNGVPGLQTTAARGVAPDSPMLP